MIEEETLQKHRHIYYCRNVTNVAYNQLWLLSQKDLFRPDRQKNNSLVLLRLYPKYLYKLDYDRTYWNGGP